MASLLIDNNLGILVKDVLLSSFPQTDHVADLGLETATDTEIWDVARIRYNAIITKDKDFYHRLISYGPPPELIWITRGNCRNRELLNLLRSKIKDIQDFIQSEGDMLIIQ